MAWVQYTFDLSPCRLLYEDRNFVTLYHADCGQSGIPAGQLALVTVMQFVEGLTDRQAADAVRTRQGLIS
jgi:transposase